MIFVFRRGRTPPEKGVTMEETRKLRFSLIRRDMDMTQGSIIKCLVIFSIPLLFGNMLQQAYNLCDTIVIGQFADNAAYSAVGNVGPITNIMVGFFVGFSTGAGVVISRNFGRNEEESVKKAVHTSIAVTAIMAVIMTVIGLAFTPTVLRLMLHVKEDDPESQAVYKYAVPYLMIYFAGISGLLFYNIGAGILRAIGDSIWPFIFLVISTVTNIGLDWLFVAVFKWGVYGVALATVIAEAASGAAAMIKLLLAKNCVKFSFKDLKIDKKILKKILIIGLPAGLQTALVAFSNVFVQSYISATNGIQDTNMAAWTTYSKVDAVLFMPLQTLALSATTFVGQNMGIGNEKRAKKGTYTAFVMALICTATLMLPIELFAPQIARILKDDEEVIIRAVMLLRCITPFYFCSCVNQVFAGAMRGAGNAIAPMLIMIGNFVGVRQLYLFICKNYVSNDLLPIGFSYPYGWLCCMIGMLLYYFIFFKYKTKKQTIKMSRMDIKNE